MKPKRLGRIDCATVELVSFNGNTGRVELRVANTTRSVIAEASYYCTARKLVYVAREITGRQREYARLEQENYERLAEYTGYKPPEAR